MTIEPREYFVLARGLEDPADSTTYYVQAVVRNARTDALIDTVNLTDNGNRRFTKEWQAPADVSGNGLYIIVTYSIYTDSAYSVRSTVYGDTFAEYLIQQRLTQALLPTGSDIDYKKIKKIIDEAIGNIKFPENKPVSFAPILEAIKNIPQIELPEQKEVDFSPLIKILQSLQQSLIQLDKRPKFEKTDLSQIIFEFKAINEFLKSKLTDEHKTAILDSLNKHGENIVKNIEGISGKVQPVEDIFGEFLKLLSKVKVKNEDSKEKNTDFITMANEQARKVKS